MIIDIQNIINSTQLHVKPHTIEHKAQNVSRKIVPVHANLVL